MANSKKMFECSDDDFMIRGQDVDELMKIARMHYKEKHGMEPSDEELRAVIREVEG